jgi:choline-sulfatase
MFTTQEYWEMYEHGVELPKYGEDCDSAQHPYAVNLRYSQGSFGFTEEQKLGIRRGYFSKITFTDQLLGKLMDAVAEQGLSDSTNIIYTADHGYMIGKFGLWYKQSLYEDGIKIPCIAAGPDYARGKKVHTPVDAHDIQASLFQTTGATRPEHWIGTPLQLIPDQDQERVIFSEYHGQGSLSGSYAIRKGDWKLIYYMAAPHQLFHLSEDPDELNNVFIDFPEKAAELEGELRRICSPEDVDKQAHAFQAEQQQHIHDYLQAARQ